MDRSGRSAPQALIVSVLGIATSIWFGQFLDRFYPCKTWLFVIIATLAGWDLLLTLACASFGHLVLTRVLRLSDLSDIEKVAFSLPLGLVGFFLGMYVAGAFGLYGSVFAVALPVAMLIAGSPAGFRALGRARPASLRGVALAATLYGTLCLGLMYLELISPDSLNYDATWYHLVISQDYARERRIIPFIAHWPNCLPDLASIVQTWSFTVPGGPIDDPIRWMMALHTEFTVFLWTLVAISACVAWLANRRVRGAWTAIFLFPGIFVYDGNIGGSADHFLALFAAPLLLACARTSRRFDWGSAALLGILAGGAVATKLQAVCMIVPIGLWLAARAIYLTAGRLRGRRELPTWSDVAKGAAIVVGCAVLVGSPHFIKNWIHYRNPLYPMMQDTFTNSMPSMPNAAVFAENLYLDWHWRPPKELAQRAWQALRLTFMFSFEPHYSFIGNRPSMGSLFTLVLPFVPFLPNARRISAGALLGMGALFMWGFTYRVDRNLHTFLPILVAVTAAAIASAWALGPAAQIGVVALVGLQLVWGADLMFSGSDRLQSGVALIKSGLDGSSGRRFSEYRRAYRELGHAMPQDAVAILHNSHVSLGINRRILLDWIGFQGLIDYRTFKTPRQAYDRFTSLGVTHFIVLPGSRPAASKQEEVIFDTLAALYAVRANNIGGFVLRDMPGTPPPDEPPFRVLTMGMDPYADGVYAVEHLGTCEELPPELQHYLPPDSPLGSGENAAVALQDVNAALIANSVRLDPASTEILGATFRAVARYGTFTVHSRSPTAR
jgi:hypothetical protein